MVRPLARSHRSYPAIVILGTLLIDGRPCLYGRVLSRPARNRSGPLTVVALAGSCAGFVVIGAMQALYGPAIPAFRAKFGVSPSVAGLGLSADFAGALIGVVIFHLLRSRLGTGGCWPAPTP
jgi:hypothetical protein